MIRTLLVIGAIIAIGVICNNICKEKPSAGGGSYYVPEPTNEERVVQLKESLNEWFGGQCIAMDGNWMTLTGGIKATVTLPHGVTLSELGNIVYQDFKPIDDLKGVGCIKLFYDMSASYNDIRYSDSIMAGSTFTFYSPDMFGYVPIQITGDWADSLSLYANIVRGDIILNGGYVE